MCLKHVKYANHIDLFCKHVIIVLRKGVLDVDVLSKMITDLCIRKNICPENRREIYQYGFKLIIADCINFAMIMLLGAVLGRFTESIAFLVTLCGIRQFSGGFHAKTFWLCRLSMLITFVCVILAANIAAHIDRCNIIFIINIFSVIIIAVLSPVEHPNKPLDDRRKKQNKLRAVVISFILAVISLVLFAAGRDEGAVISATLLAVVILMAVGIAVRKGGEQDVQQT